MEFENLNKVQKMYAFSDQEMSNYLEIEHCIDGKKLERFLSLMTRK